MVYQLRIASHFLHRIFQTGKVSAGHAELFLLRIHTRSPWSSYKCQQCSLDCKKFFVIQQGKVLRFFTAPNLACEAKRRFEGGCFSERSSIRHGHLPRVEQELWNFSSALLQNMLYPCMPRCHLSATPSNFDIHTPTRIETSHQGYLKFDLFLLRLRSRVLL